MVTPLAGGLPARTHTHTIMRILAAVAKIICAKFERELGLAERLGLA